MEQINQVLLSFAASILTILLGLLLAYVAAYVQKASKALQEKSKFDLVDKSIERLEHLTLQTVMAIEEESGKLIREAVTNGNITKEEGRRHLIELAGRAKERVLVELGDQALDALQEQFVNVESLLSDVVEVAVVKVKRGL